MAGIAKLEEKYPWVEKPIIINAPMAKFAGPALVTEMVRAGGLGFVGGGYDLDAVATTLDEVKQRMASTDLPSSAKSHPLPVGLGMLCFGWDKAKASKVLAKYTPKAVWLFAASSTEDYAVWCKYVREACDADIWIQTGSVGEALELAKSCKPDVLVMQGTDAGGHGPEKAAGIISLLPEALDALAAAGFGHIPLVAAGGIVDGRSVAAAHALGAAGVVMGTRFLACTEAGLPHPGYQKAVLALKDGGQNTVRTKLFDEIKPKGNDWPDSYDGRGIRNASFVDSAKGMAIEDNRKLLKESQGEDGGGYRDEPNAARVTIFAGTGVGLVNEVKSANTIVTEAREQARRTLANLQLKLS